MLVEKIPVSGGYLVSDLIGGHYTRRIYYGYSKKEAVALFREEFPYVRRLKERRETKHGRPVSRN